jgi:uncharacterized protein (UPF0305 family)
VASNDITYIKYLETVDKMVSTAKAYDIVIRVGDFKEHLCRYIRAPKAEVYVNQFSFVYKESRLVIKSQESGLNMFTNSRNRSTT